MAPCAAAAAVEVVATLGAVELRAEEPPEALAWVGVLLPREVVEPAAAAVEVPEEPDALDVALETVGVEVKVTPYKNICESM